MPSLRTAVVLTLTAAAAAVVPAGAACAAGPGDPAGPLPGRSVADTLPTSGIAHAVPAGPVTGAVGAGTGPVKHLTLDPLAGSGVDPLDNAVGTQVADFKPVSTAAVTGPVTSGGSLATMPVVGTAAGMLPG